MPSSEPNIEFYAKNGYVLLPNFLTPDEVTDLKGEVASILSQVDLKAIHAGRNDELSGTDYQIDSLNKNSIWFEADAINDKGEVVVPIHRAVHKIAHGIHINSPVARRTTFSDKLKHVVRTYSQFEDPAVIQGMYLLKQPKIGDPRPSHQDETYLRTAPIGKVIGIWIALDDATEENGCLQFIPGSHKWPLTRFYVRKGAQSEGSQTIGYEGDADYMNDPMTDRFVATPAPSGSLILIHGLVVHKSEGNLSKKSRNAFSFHLYEKKNVKWNERNWCQETDGYKFWPYYQTKSIA